MSSEDMQHLPTPAQVNKVGLETVDITQEKVKRKLVQLKDSKTPGPDLIHPRILSETANDICYPLTRALLDLWIFHHLMGGGGGGCLNTPVYLGSCAS